MERIFSSGSCSIMRMDSGLRSTRARAVTISVTYRPPPYSLQRRRKALLVTPAIGARTTGVSTVSLPSFRGGRVRRGASEFTPILWHTGANREPDSAEGVQEHSASSATVRRRRYARGAVRERGGGAFHSPAPSARVSQQAQYREPTRSRKYRSGRPPPRRYRRATARRSPEPAPPWRHQPQPAPGT